ncbi:PilT protein domain protein [Solidesulfovibrio carbinoliphilus subsp. oakridgensis]|uniref:Ribonuclease VapC n=1 Tax=Solidesulfovibrio carbinoliphilus subsp. oakridgensis TaxID=694327 RepID=G7Q8B7_9BACT|nr:PIN domain-containing protein [Solidesulfovibrio carbinoliphilus]EHJ48529.1 PilT protein domain protein [Solidesulfovibrio carbinoliphilus subsp. oakridgensis]
MRALFDTSVLVAALVKSHPLHERAYPWYLKGRRGELEMIVAAHGLAETYASLTTYPSRPRVSPRVASVIAVAAIISLDAREYLAAMDAVARIGRGGGSIYDALHVIAAQKSGADIVLSFNRKHFEPLIETGQQFIDP